MKSLLFILPIIAFSFNLKAQQVDFVADSNEPAAGVEEEFLEIVRGGHLKFTDSFIRGYELDLSGELGERALVISIINDGELLGILWQAGARLRYEDGNIVPLSRLHTLVGKLRSVRETQSEVEEAIDRAFTRTREAEMSFLKSDGREDMLRTLRMWQEDQINIVDIAVACNKEDIAVLRTPLTIPESATVNEMIESVGTASRSIRESVSTSCLSLIEQAD